MKKLLLLLVFLTVLHGQETIERALPSGAYRPLRKQARSVPRYYICGAGVWKRKEMTPQPNHCYQHCNTKRKWYGKKYCSWETRCNPVPPVLAWIRTNGIKFQYCHFQHWDQQITIEEAGNWDWQGMNMCPEKQYVYGIRTKLTTRDGLAALVLLCRNPKSVKETSEKLVFDGDGSWGEAIASSNFAIGFKARYIDGYIDGIGLDMAAMPFIFAFNFKYQFPKDFNTAPSMIDNAVVYNYGPTQMRKQIQFNKQKQLQRVWQNEKGYMHGTSLSNTLSQSLTTTIKIGVPFLSQKQTATSTQSMTQTTRQQSMENFKFGVTQTFLVGQKQKDVMFVPSCTKFTIKQLVYYSDTDIPYKVELGYSNGFTTQYEVIGGWYRGVSTGEAETIINSEKIC